MRGRPASLHLRQFNHLIQALRFPGALFYCARTPEWAIGARTAYLTVRGHHNGQSVSECVHGDRRGREWGRRADEVVGAPDAVPPLAPTMSLIPRGRHGTLQLYAHPSGANSPQLSPFALTREPDVPATRFSPTPSRAPPTPLPSPGSCATNTPPFTTTIAYADSQKT